MTFVVNGIKQERDEEHKIELLICVEASLLARKLLQTYNILILNVKEYAKPPETFGDIHFTITQDFSDIEVVTKEKDLQHACEFFTSVGFPIAAINSYSHPIAKQASDAAIAAAQERYRQQKADEERMQKEEAEKEKKVFEDVHLESAKKIIERVFEKIDETTKRSANTISGPDLKHIKALSEELKKLRMGNNFEKIRETIEEIFKLLEKVNDEYYASMQNANDTISSESLVTPSDVDKELERMENIRILKSLGAHISLANQDYATFGPTAIYRKFLQKDLLLKLADPIALLYGLYDIAEFIITIVIVLLGVYTVANSVYLFSDNQYRLSYSLMSVGVRGIIAFFARKLRRRAIGRLLLLIVLAFALRYALMRGMTTNFAL